MMFLPAIDLMDGRCVRLRHGEKANKTEYAGDPAETARGFARDGADAIHLVDLDGAFEGRRKNQRTILEVVLAAGIPVEVGGGIRALADMEALFEAGVWRVIVGTAAVKAPSLVEEALRAFGPERIVLGLDVREGTVAIQGWTEKAPIVAKALALDMKRRGLRTMIYTEISRDGALLGPDIEGTRAIAEETGLEVIASGGISSLADIRRLCEAEGYGIRGFIVGKAIYEGLFTVKEAAALVRGEREAKKKE
jgi:phosphoribosylformimino-5-aminoimidazole carboxamide ribotide isomerase